MTNTETNGIGQSSEERFKDLTQVQQQQYRRIINELMTCAQGYTIPMCFAPPLITAEVPLIGVPIKLPLSLGKIDGASGCVLQLESGYFFMTAEHVLGGEGSYEERVAAGERLNWQIGNLPPFDPLSRIAWRDNANDRSLMPRRATDVVLLRLSEQEATEACGAARIVPIPMEWPPTQLTVGQLVVLAGFPNQLRTIDLRGTMNREACGLAFEVTTIGEGYCKCQFAYADLINFGGESQAPLDLGTVNLGGMSGCPAFALASSSRYEQLRYPQLIGVFTQRWGGDTTSDIIEIATLERVYQADFRGVA
jgi:hypothetical protein